MTFFPRNHMCATADVPLGDQVTAQCCSHAQPHAHHDTTPGKVHPGETEWECCGR